MAEHDVAVVLSGGASQAAYHAGVLKALFHGESPAASEGIDPSVITGTSAGSVNAVALLSHMEGQHPHPAEFVEELWLDKLAQTGTSCGNGGVRLRGSPTSFANAGCLLSNPIRPVLDLFEDARYFAQESVNRGRQIVTATTGFTQRLLDQFNFADFVTTDRLARVISQNVDFNLIQESPRSLRVGAVDWDTGKLRYFTNEDMSVDVGPKIVQASSAVPALFPRVVVNGVRYGDGVAVENTPLQGAIQANANVIHVITSFPPAINIPREEAANSLDTIFRMLVINLYKSLRRDVERMRNINDAILVLDVMEKDGVSGCAPVILRKTLDRILDNSNLPPRQVTIHVHRPPEPLGHLLDLFNFKREYLQGLVRKGYHDTVTHNCEVNGCVLPVDEETSCRLEGRDL